MPLPRLAVHLLALPLLGAGLPVALLGQTSRARVVPVDTVPAIRPPAYDRGLFLSPDDSVVRPQWRAGTRPAFVPSVQAALKAASWPLLTPEFRVTEGGTVDTSSVELDVYRVDSPLLRENLLQAMSTWQFAPGVVNGRPRAMFVRMTLASRPGMNYCTDDDEVSWVEPEPGGKAVPDSVLVPFLQRAHREILRRRGAGRYGSLTARDSQSVTFGIKADGSVHWARYGEGPRGTDARSTVLDAVQAAGTDRAFAPVPEVLANRRYEIWLDCTRRIAW